MYASLLTCRVPSDRREEFLRLLERTIPEAKQIRGLQRGYLLTDPASDTIVLVGLYATEADAREAGLGDRFEQMQGTVIHTLVPESIERRLYEVTRALEVG
jgi:quinol monooxygenase YgiN